MTLISEIRAGKTCPGCSSDCRNFVKEADECIYNTWISGLYSEVVEDEADKEVHYTPENKEMLMVKFR